MLLDDQGQAPIQDGGNKEILMRTRHTAASAVLLSCVILLGACSGEPGPRLRDAAPGTGGIVGQIDTKAETPYSFDDATLCLVGPGSVTIEKVEIVAPTGGLRLGTFSVLPSKGGKVSNYISDPRQRLDEVGFPTQGPMTVDRVCPPASDGGVFLLGVEVTKPADATASGSGFVVSYRSGEETHRTYLPPGIVLCQGSDPDLPDCDRKLDLRPPP
ncbi:hypothetical protein [Actinokineospora alba]|uniref:hypothetical protein n=1 Tax=Actinokineospora alba TaxID=504798 RepID=UPI000B87B2A1|nr:hypothetical protein [Actinokineospora alba]